MEIKFKKIPKFLNPWSALLYNGAPSNLFSFPGYTPGIKLTNVASPFSPFGYGTQETDILKKISGRNNIYFSDDFNKYNQWHSDNIVMPFYDKLSMTPRDMSNYDFEKEFIKALDSWNNAGGFDWFNANDKTRAEGLQSAGTRTHLNLYYNDPILRLLDDIIGKNSSSYVFPKKANSADFFGEKKAGSQTYITRIGRNGLVSDNDFGVQTGNRRPTIHISTNLETTQKWDNFFRNLGYVGAYQYLDHWIPTKDRNRAIRIFSEVDNNIMELNKFIPTDSYNDKPFNTSPSNLKVTNPVLQQSLTVITQPEEDSTGGTGTGDTLGESKVTANGSKGGGFDWESIGLGIQKIFGNPNLLGFGRLAGTLINNEKIYDEALKGINPILKLSYHTYRQVVGDEATKQAYYRRAAQGLTRAAQAFTSDADRQMAYLFEAKRIGDELRAQGDLADNQEIRRTSDESNQHLWANTQRDTEVANYNIAALQQADSARHNLLSQKHSALWSSIDNYLKTIETRRLEKQEKLNALQDLKFLLNEEDYIYAPEYLNEYNLLKNAKEKATNSTTHILDTSDPGYVNALKRWKAFLHLYLKDLLERMLQYRLTGKIIEPEAWVWSTKYLEGLKSGGKITHKKKDDLLYKSTRDVVEHFRKMSKLSSDSLNRKGPKIEKLADHPKSKTKKYLYGGTAPFTVWTPAVSGGERTYESSSSSSSSKKSSEKSESLDLMKELFKLLNVEGLPSDTNLMYALVMSFLSERNGLTGIDNIDTSDMATLYVSMLQRIGNIKYNKLLYDAAQKIVNDKNAGSEIAMDLYGRIAVQNIKDRSIKFVDPDEFKESKGLILLTNSDLLLQRATNPNLAFDLTGIITIANNATGKEEIAKYIKENLPKMEKTVTEMYSTLDAKVIKDGLQLLKDAPEGIYKIKNTNQIKLAEYALNYILGVLPPLMSKFLSVQAQLTGQNPKQMIVELLSSNIHALMQEGIEFDAVKNESENDLDKLGINSATQLLLGMSSPREFTFSTGNGNMFNGMARVSSITKDGNSLGADFAYSEIYKSDLHKNLDLDNASFGDVPINKALKDRIIIDNSTIAGVDLPYTTDANGRIIPDFNLLSRIEEADKEIMRQGIDPDSNPQAVNAIYTSYKLPIKYNLDNRLTENYKRFAVILATAIEDVFLNKDGLASNGTLTLVSDEDELNKYIEEIKKVTGQKEIDMDRKGWGTGDKDIYKGSIFIPIIGDLVDAVSATGLLKAGNYDELRNKYETKNYNKAPQFVKQ